MKHKREVISLITGFLGAFLGLYGVIIFNQYVFMSLPLALRMISGIIVYWAIALVPVIVMLFNKEKPADYGFAKERIAGQIITGILIGIAMSLVLTLIPHTAGFGGYVDSGKRYKYAWQFIYEFFYCIMAIGFVEEFVFRGFIYKKTKDICQNEFTAIIVSSVSFGLFHLFSGNIVQMVMTAFIGAFFCFCRIKIKNCSVISLIIAHGIYDALITVWASLLLN